MQDQHTSPRSTTIRVSRHSRDELRSLADDDGVTLDEEVQLLVRAERQRRMGEALATLELDDHDSAWLDASGSDVGRHAGG